MPHVKTLFSQSSYAMLLKTDQWKDFAGGVRARKGNFCECCKRGHIPTQVHHIFYEQEREPWEYDDSEVMVLCFTCHTGMHEGLKQFRKRVFKKLTPQTIRVLNGALTVALDHYDPLTFVHALAEIVTNERLIANHARAWSDESEPRKASAAPLEEKKVL